MRKLGTTASPCPGGRHAQPQHLTRPLRLAGLRVLRPLLPQRLRRSSPGRRRPGLVPDQGPRPRYPRYEVLGEMSRRFVAAVEKLAADQQIPLIEFERGQRKEDIAAPLFEKARLADREGVVLIGWAQERVNVFSPPNKQDRQSGKFAPKRHPARPKTFYFYIWDRDWGPTNIRICTYAPFAMRINLNGQMWLIQHLRRSGHYVETIDNGIADVDDKEALRRLCRRFLGRDFNRRLLQLERQSHRAAPSATQIQALVMPSGPASHRVPGLRLGAPRVAALLAALCRFQLIFGGFRRHQLQQLVSEHLGADYSGRPGGLRLGPIEGEGPHRPPTPHPPLPARRPGHADGHPLHHRPQPGPLCRPDPARPAPPADAGQPCLSSLPGGRSPAPGRNSHGSLNSTQAKFG